MTIYTHRRQSTTAKITLHTHRLIASSCGRGEGVIVRKGGVEYGVTDVVGSYYLTFEGVTLHRSECTILKTTVSELSWQRLASMIELHPLAV